MMMMKSFVLLAVAVAAHAQAQNAGPGGSGMGMRMHKRNNPVMKKRIADAIALLERQASEPPLDISFPGQGASATPSGGAASTAQSSSTSSTTSTTQPPPSSSSTTTPRADPPTTTSTTSTTSTTPTTTSTSTSSSSTSTSTSSSTSSSTSNIIAVTAISRTSQDNYAGISFASTGSVPLRASQTTSDDAATDTSDSSGGSFSQNKVAIAATATVAAIVALGALIFLGFWWKKKSDHGKMREDMWDEASMKEFPGAGVPVVAPPPAARHLDLDDELGGSASSHSHGGMGAAIVGGLGRSNTKVLPSQSAYIGAGGAAVSRARSQHTTEYGDEPDELLAMPPVAHHERPRDSAYDIVPAAPPANAYAGGAQGYTGARYGYGNAAASGSGGYGGEYDPSGGLAPPQRKGDHTSFGSGLGHDPFAGSGFLDADRESTYGPGQAGRGAGGGAVASGAASVQGAGNQWPQGYNPYTGYSQGSQAPYGQAGYGYAS